MIVNQLKRQGEEINKLGESLETKKASESKLERQVREAQRKYADLETRMKEDLMMARIRDAENTQCVAELTQKISSLEYKVKANFCPHLLAKKDKGKGKKIHARKAEKKFSHLVAQWELTLY